MQAAGIALIAGTHQRIALPGACFIMASSAREKANSVVMTIME